MLPIEKHLSKLIASLPLVKQSQVELEHPADSQFGDYSCNIAMQLFGQLSAQQREQYDVNSPRELALKMIDGLENSLEQVGDLAKYIEKIEVAGAGFLNFYLTPHFFAESLTEILSTPTFGQSSIGQGITWELEHTSPNPNKAMHLGHLRNNLIGMALGRLWEAVGIKVIYEAVDNNRGIAIAKLMWGFLKFARKDAQTPIEIDHWVQSPEKWHTPKELEQRPDRFVDELYVKAAEDFEQDEQVATQVRQLVINWEAEDSKTWKLWEHVLSYSYQGQQLTLERLGNRWDKVYHEHEHYQQGKEIVALGLKKGVFNQSQDGAVITNLEQYKLPNTVVIKSDGTALYITQDLALTKLKVNQVKAQRYHWVVGPEQRLALQQFFTVCEQLGFANHDDLLHLSYGYMSIKSQGKMSSRLGNVLYIDDLLDMAVDKALTLITSQGLLEEEKKQLAEQVGVGAVKYAILKVSRTQDMAFDIKAALSLEGNSGPYLQYTFARAMSVMRKAELTLRQVQELFDQEGRGLTATLDETYHSQQALAILQNLYQFPAVVQQAAYNYEPSLVANYLYQLAQAFNSFYNQQQILVDEANVKQFRLAITAAVARVIKQGLELLGIEAPERM